MIYEADEEQIQITLSPDEAEDLAWALSIARRRQAAGGPTTNKIIQARLTRFVDRATLRWEETHGEG